MACTDLSFNNHSLRALAMTDSQDVISVLWGHRPSPTKISWSSPDSIPWHHTPEQSLPIQPRCFVAKIKEKEVETNMYQCLDQAE